LKRLGDSNKKNWLAITDLCEEGHKL